MRMSSTTAAPVLSTPDSHILNETIPPQSLSVAEQISDQQLYIRYEVGRTVNEIRSRQWSRVALQFPDHMLQHSARVYQLLSRGLTPAAPASIGTSKATSKEERHSDLVANLSELEIGRRDEPVKLTILADTSYGYCCVDEIAAEHVDVDAVVHYGRACLSPTARLPVLHIFTQMDLKLEDVLKSFVEAFPDRNSKIIMTADPPYSNHVHEMVVKCQGEGYSSVFEASLINEPSSSIPNRTVPGEVKQDPRKLREWSLFHISDPPTSLLLALSSKMNSVIVSPTSASTNTSITTSTSMLLRRRYALVTSLTTVPIWGILINTLSVKNYMDMVTHVKSQIAAAGKKSYLFVVGKINAAKVANFSEIGGWVVIGCWESSLIDSKDFYKPVITPFELSLALQDDKERLWTGEWRSDFESTLEASVRRSNTGNNELNGTEESEHEDEDAEDESDSEPPEFDLRTGRYISRSRPMQKKSLKSAKQVNRRVNGHELSTALTKTGKKDMIAVNGIASPAAEFLANRRTWKGLGSDFEVKYEEEQGSVIEEGRSGIARGYTVGDTERT